MTTDVDDLTNKTNENDNDVTTSGDLAISQHPATKALLFPAVNAVFQPSAEVIGAELKGWVENKLSNKKKDRIQKHTDNAKSKSSAVVNAELKSERQLHNFEIWVGQVGEVDPENPIASAWQSILEDIANDDPETEVYLNALKSLNPAEAAFFVEYVRYDANGMHADKKSYYLEKLKDKGLLRKGVDSIFKDMFFSFYRKFGIDLEKRHIAKHELTWIGTELANKLNN